MAKILDNICSLKDCVEKLELLEDKDYLIDNWITEDEAKYLREEISNDLKHYENEVWEYLNYISWQRQEASITLTWLKAEINRLEDLALSFDKKIERFDKWIDYIMKYYWIGRLTTNLYQLSYRKSESVEISNEELLPKEFIKESVVTRPDKTAIKEALKNWLDVPWASIKVSQNLQVK